MKFLTNSKGFSLIEAILASAIMCVGVGSMAMFMDVFSKSNKQISNRDIVETKKQEIINLILDRTNWAYTVANTANTTFDCIRLRTDCASLVGAGSTFKVYNSSSQILLDTVASTTGFNTAGKDCSQFNASTSNPNCPYRYALSWEPICPSSGACTRPRIKVTGTFSAPPDFFNTLSTSKSLTFTVAPPTEAISNPLAFNDTYYVLKNAAAADFNVLSNDKPTVGQTISVVLISAQSTMALANLSLNGNLIRYEPAVGFTGLDTFQYRITQPDGGVDTGTVWVKVMTPYTWTGEGPDLNWTTASNWCGGVKADYSGCTVASSAPANSDSVIFDNTTRKMNANINANIDVMGIDLNTGYAGTLTQMSGATMTIRGTGYKQVAGTFVGGNSDIVMRGDFSATGGTFRSTTANLEFLGVWATMMNVTMGPNLNFIHNSGKVKFTHVANLTGSFSSKTFYNLDFTPIQASWFDLGTTSNIEVANNLTFGVAACGGAGGKVSQATITVYGNILGTGNCGPTGSAIVRMAGTSNQVIDFSAPAGGSIPNLVIDKTGGATVSLLGTVRVGGSFDLRIPAANLITTGSTLEIQGWEANSYFNAGGAVFNNLNIDTYQHLNMNGSTGTVAGTFKVGGACGGGVRRVNNGTLYIEGDIIVGNTPLTTCGAEGSAQFIIRGTNNQTITTSPPRGYQLPNVTVAKTGGALNLNGRTEFWNGFQYTSGTVNVGTNTVAFYTFNNSMLVSAMGLAFYDVEFYPYYTSTIDLQGTTLSIAHDVLFESSGCRGRINNGTIQTQGNVRAGTLYNCGTTGTANISMVGNTTDATITTSAAGYIPAGLFTIDKPGRTVTLTSHLNLNLIGTNPSLSVVNGTLNMAGYNLNVRNNITNAGNLIRGTSPSCGTITQSGTFSGTAAICNP